jgi:hypothetical protein
MRHFRRARLPKGATFPLIKTELRASVAVQRGVESIRRYAMLPFLEVEGARVKGSGFTSHRGAAALLEGVELIGLILELVQQPDLKIRRGCGPAVKDHVEARLTGAGWALPIRINPALRPDLNALHQATRTVLQVQTGNMARAFYDLMKMQSLHDQERAACGVLIVPSNLASRVIGSNLANFERVREELQSLFYDQITIPVLLVAFE